MKAEKKMFTALVANVTSSHVEILCSADSGEVGTMRLPYKAYDQEIRAYVDSDEARERIDENLEEMGLEFDTVADAAPGTRFEGYIKDERVTLWEPREFVSFTPIRKAEARALRSLAKSFDFTTIPLTEFKGERFNFGISAEVNGEQRNFKISQFVFEDEDGDEPERRVSTKYTTRDITNFKQVIERGQLSGDALERANNALDKLIARAREDKIEQFKSVLGLDINELMESGDPVTVQIRVESMPSTEFSFLSATLVTDEGEANADGDDE